MKRQVLKNLSPEELEKYEVHKQIAYSKWQAKQQKLYNEYWKKEKQ